VAQGRIWSGAEAYRVGLVDRIGGIREAVEEVRNLCHLSPKRRVRLVEYARKVSLREMLLPAVGITTWLQGIWDLAQILQEEILVLLPFDIRIR
jgi:ClpP class serine protease